MAKFTVRVELHDAESDDYALLHEEMEKKGFSRTITGGKGVVYHLPTAEYVLDGDFTMDQVYEKAKLAADQTWEEFGLLVNEVVSRQWVGLKRVK